jgi:putative membrane protein insertion efficiency factor
MTAAAARPEAYGEEARPRLVARGLVVLVRIYQVARAGRVSPCRFTPSCSEFAVEAISRHGPRRGLAFTAKRLVRCRPGGPFGYDPVP